MTQRKRSFAFHSYEALWGVYRIHEAWLMIIKQDIKEFNTPLSDEALCTRGFRLIDSTRFLPELDSLVGDTGSWKPGSLGWFVSPAGGTLKAIPLKRLFQNISPSTACLVSPVLQKPCHILGASGDLVVLPLYAGGIYLSISCTQHAFLRILFDQVKVKFSIKIIAVGGGLNSS